jgi:hypothetical protein
MGQRVNLSRYRVNPLNRRQLPGRNVIWVRNCITYDFPSKRMADPSQRVCLIVSEYDDVVGLECNNKVPTIASDRYLPPRR